MKYNPTVNMAKSPTLHLYLICSCFVGIIIFLYGFFPIKYVSTETSTFDDLPNIVKDVRLDKHDFYYSRINPLVFIVIDALRWDFLTKSENILNVPYISKLLNSGQACLFHAECSPPTVTMPRLKALMTGSVPNFIDVILNLGSSEIKGDSLITQAADNNKKVVFYGDDTWLKMFPSSFLRSEGTTSFFVTDYEEVDLNVTRHIHRELASPDWDIMVLHYLGLDHIGHLAGPNSPLIGPKLREMDQVVEMILEGVNNTNKDGLSPMLVLAGDHGMRNSGGHGGSTPDEILTSLLFVQPGCSESKGFKQRVWQTDVTPTLAVLLGLPIPHNSVGTLIPEVLAPLPPLHRLYALHYNAHHLKKLAIYASCFDKESEKHLSEAEKTFAQLLKSSIVDEKVFERSVRLYEIASHEISHCLAHSDAGFHVVEMVAACGIFLLIIVSTIASLLLSIKKTVTPKSIITAAVLSAVLVAYLFKFTIATLVIVFTITLTANLSRLWRFTEMNLVKKIQGVSCTSNFLVVGCILHAVSLCGSSLVEEEHQTWYFFWISLNVVKLFAISAQTYAGEIHVKSWAKPVLRVIFLMLAHRFLRTLNQTGDKWSDLPDFGDWLREPENWLYHLFFTIAGLLGVWASLRFLNKTNDAFCKSASAAALVFVLLCRAANSEVKLPFSYPKSKGVNEGNCFWLLVLLACLRQIWKTRRILETFTTLIFLTLTLLLRPHNLILLPFLTFASHVLFSLYPSLFECTLVHAWMGSAAFFYQGNSNSLTTIDVAAGYVGAANHNMIRVGLLVFFHTLAAPIVSFLLLLIEITKDKHFSKNIDISLQVITLQKLIPLFVTCSICVIHRHHLFVWSVFAPKLLYEIMSSMTVLLLVMPFWLLLFHRTRQRRD